MKQNEDTNPKRNPRHGWAAGLVIGALSGAALTGGLALSSAKAAAVGFQFAGHGVRTSESSSPEAVRERVDFAVDWILGRIDADEQQRAEVKGIVGSALVDLAPSVGEHRQNREALAAELAKPTLDRNAIEEIRKAEIALFDQASSRFVTALADVSEVLTPEQRTELLEMAARFHR